MNEIKEIKKHKTTAKSIREKKATDRAAERKMREMNLADDIDLQVQIRSTRYLQSRPVQNRMGINSRVQQLKGMIELVELLPEHTELVRLLALLEAHLSCLKQKQQHWPV